MLFLIAGFLTSVGMTKYFLASGLAAGAGLFADCDFYVVVEGGEEVRDAFEGESVEAVVCEGGDFGLIDVESAAAVPQASLRDAVAFLCGRSRR